MAYFSLKHRTENKCRLSLGESSVFPFFRGANGDNKRSHDTYLSYPVHPVNPCGFPQEQNASRWLTRIDDGAEQIND